MDKSRLLFFLFLLFLVQFQGEFRGEKEMIRGELVIGQMDAVHLIAIVQFVATEQIQSMPVVLRSAVENVIN